MILRVENLTVCYGALRAVDSVDFGVRAGSIHGVIGPNGAGKSSFIDALSGRLQPSEGAVVYRDADISRRSAVWRRRNGIARSFQRTSIFPSLTVGDQLELVAHQTGEKDLDGVVGALSLGSYWNLACELISYGDQRRVDVALALLGNPAVLLLDEPAAGLSGDDTRILIDHVRLLAQERSISVVLVEHDVDAVFRVCDEITVLDLGSVLAHGSPEEVRSDPGVIEAYLGTEGSAK